MNHHLSWSSVHKNCSTSDSCCFLSAPWVRHPLVSIVQGGEYKPTKALEMIDSYVATDGMGPFFSPSCLSLQRTRMLTLSLSLSRIKCQGNVRFAMVLQILFSLLQWSMSAYRFSACILKPFQAKWRNTFKSSLLQDVSNAFNQLEGIKSLWSVDTWDWQVIICMGLNPVPDKAAKRFKNRRTSNRLSHFTVVFTGNLESRYQDERFGGKAVKWFCTWSRHGDLRSRSQGDLRENVFPSLQ